MSASSGARSAGTFSVAISWLRGLVRGRPRRLGATAIGIAIAVGLLASLGAFLAASKATMTARAVASVSVDWQIEAQPGVDLATMSAAVAADPMIDSSKVVTFAATTGLEATHGATTQTTGAGQVVGLPDGYRDTFPAEIRDLAGASGGVLLFQQTAANLGAARGDTVTIARAGLDPVAVTVDGIVDLPNADSLFQNVGAPAGAQPTAPPDNVLLVPAATWHRLFDPLATQRPDLVRTQVHARLTRQLPHDPAAAYAAVTGAARHLEAGLAGGGIVGDNLSATLAAAREDALYAQVLFLVLAAPGVVLAGLLTATVAAAGAESRRREHALLRTRGASTRQLVGLAAIQALLVGALGAGVGLGVAAIVGHVAFGTARFGSTSTAAIVWAVVAAAVGIVIAALAVAVPTARDARADSVVTARRRAGRTATPTWQRLGVDVVLLAGAATVYWLTSRNGYRLVLAPEGVPTISVSYWAVAGPALAWVGVGLLTYRVVMVAVERGRVVFAGALRPMVGGIGDAVAATLQRQRRLLARGAALVALAIAFAVSTAVFNATYRHQAEIDAVLTNGADVTVTVSPGASVAPDSAPVADVAAVAGVRHVEPVQHRFAYVGADLQELYGVDPATILDAGQLQDAYFRGGTARQLIDALAAHDDNVLVSAETVHDYQLRPGDAITLRLQQGGRGAYIEVPFHYAGVVNEFPTAPTDSFLVANAAYVAQATGSGDIGELLVDTGGRDVAAVAERVRTVLGPSAAVTDLVTSRRIIGSSLTSVDLGGLTKVELSFAIALAAAATGITLWLGLDEQRRTFAIASALGATPRQLAAFVWSQVATVLIGGLVAGAVAAWVLAHMLVNVLRGVFDPPPSTLGVPWAYLAAVLVVAVVAAAVAAVATVRHVRTPRLELLRAL